MRRREALALCGAGAIWCAAGRPTPARAGVAAEGAGEPEPLFDSDGYRRTRYRAPVDRDPAPARTVPLEQALRLRPGRDALFFDVLPAEGARRDPVSGRWLAPPDHSTIPGARWFPEVGRASPDPQLWAGFVAAALQQHGHHPRWPLIVFCRADCWMSWNAARRLARAGLPGVLWLAEGIDGWHDRGGRLAAAAPEITPP